MSKLSDKRLIEITDTAFKNFKGNSKELTGAIGHLMVGRHIGWKPLLLILDKSTVKKYEDILGIEFRDVLEPEGTDADRSIAWTAVKKIKSFWKAVKGEVPGVKSPNLTNR